MEWRRPGFRITDHASELQIERIHGFLSREAYWSKGLPLDVLKRAIAGSLCFGLFDETAGQQIGFVRVVTDRATFAWVCDVYVEEKARGHGHALWMMQAVKAHPDLQGLRRWCLATRDAHGLYRQVGFEVTKTPDLWMEIKDNDIYLKRTELA